jgi:hypothetical protein
MSDVERDFWRTRNGRRPGVVAFGLVPGAVTTAVTDGDRPATVIAALDPDGVAEPGLVVSVLFSDGRSPEGMEVSVEDGADVRRLIELGRIGKCLVEGLPPGPVRCAIGGHVALTQSPDPIVREILARPVAGSLAARFIDVAVTLGDVERAMEAILAEHHASRAVLCTGSIEGRLEWAVAKGTGSGGIAPDLGVHVDRSVKEALGSDVRITIRRDATTCTVNLHGLPTGLPVALRVFVAVSGPAGVSSFGEFIPEGSGLGATVHWPHDEAPDAVTVALFRS